jgi:hypothetical protein
MSAEAAPVAAAEVISKRGKPKAQADLRVVSGVRIDPSRDALLTEFGKKTLEDRYLLPDESFQGMFARVATAYADDSEHAQRIYDYISKLWFMPATPVLSNGGADRGLPISCFLNDVPDSLDGIVGVWNENVALASNGGGIGTYWGKVRSIGEKVKTGKTSGIIPFESVQPYEACSRESTEDPYSPGTGCGAQRDYSCNALNTARTCSTFADSGGECVALSYFPNATIAEWGMVQGAPQFPERSGTRRRY